MAEWSRDKVLSENINKGKEFTTDDDLTVEELNAMVNAGLYSQDQAEISSALAKNQPDSSDANNVGTPSVIILNTGTTSAKFKFSNLKGNKGDKGDKGDQGIQGIKGDKGDANSLSIGSVSSGTTASATITGTAPNQVLNLVIPKGDTGQTGDSIQMRVSGGYFQWKYTQATEWQNLIAVSALSQIDSAISDSSTNAVQNKVIKSELDKKLAKSGGIMTGQISFDKAKGFSFNTESGNEYVFYGDGVSGGKDIWIVAKNGANVLGYYKFFDADGKLYSGNSQTVDLASEQTIPGNKTLSGTITITGTLII